MQWLIDLLLHRGNDLSTYFIPNAYFFKRFILENHSIPLWNPIQFSGFPYLADPQNYIFYPPNYAFLILRIETAFVLLLFAHLVLAGIGSYYLTRKTFKLEKLPAIFSALALTLTPMISSHLEAGHYTMINAFAWLPWFFLAMFKLIDKPAVKTAVALAVVSWLIYLNYINIAYFALLFFTLCAAAKLNKQLFISALVYAAVFIGLISPVLISQLELAPLTTRSLLTFADVAQPVWNLKLFTQNLLFPYRLNHLQASIERIIYPGIGVLVFAVIGIIGRKKLDRFGLGWLIFSLFYMLGSSTPVFGFFYRFLPGISWMRITTRMWIIALSVFIVPYAGLGFQLLWRRKKIKLFTVILGTLTLFELLVINHNLFSRPIQADRLPNSFYQLISADNQKDFRVYCTTGCFSLQKLGEMDIKSLAGNNPVQLTDFTHKLEAAAGYHYQGYIPVLPPYPVFNHFPQPNAKLMADLNTKYLASPYQLTDPQFKLINQQADFYLYQNLHPLSTEADFHYFPPSLKIGLSLFILTLLAAIYAYRHP